MQSGKTDPQFFPAGDGALVVQFGEEIDPAVNRRAARFTGRVEQAGLRGIRELIPTFCTVAVVYDPCLTTYDKLIRQLRRLLSDGQDGAAGVRRIHVLPVCYGGEMGPDLPFVARHSGLTEQEVIQCHSDRDYLIYMLGFLPGFSYLGGLDHRLITPRLTTPRTKIPAGSVGIGGEQTGVYPLDSPGGWQLIGRTPVRPYDPCREPAILYRAGDYIRFSPVTPEEYRALERDVAAGCYRHILLEEA